MKVVYNYCANYKIDYRIKNSPSQRILLGEFTGYYSLVFSSPLVEEVTCDVEIFEESKFEELAIGL